MLSAENEADSRYRLPQTRRCACLNRSDDVKASFATVIQRTLTTNSVKHRVIFAALLLYYFRVRLPLRDERLNNVSGSSEYLVMKLSGTRKRVGAIR